MDIAISDDKKQVISVSNSVLVTPSVLVQNLKRNTKKMDKQGLNI